MCTIYENIKSLCDQRGIKPGKMCTDIGLSKSILTGLKNGTKKNIQTDTAQKIADYFGVSVDRVLGTDNKKSPAPEGAELSEARMKLLAAIDGMSEEEVLAMVQMAEAAKKMRGDGKL